MGDVDPEELARLRVMLEVVPSLSARRVAAQRRERPPGSLASQDPELPDGRFVAIFAGQQLAYAIDALGAWRTIVHGSELPIVSHLVLLRSALESSVRARWFVDSTVGAGERVARGIAAHREDQLERGKFERSLPDRGASLRAIRGPEGRTAAERVAELDNRIAVEARKRAGVPTVGFTDTTSLMRENGVEPWYRLLSGLTHGKEWTLPLSVLAPDPVPPMSPGVAGGTVSMSMAVAVGLTDLTIERVALALSEFERYHQAAPATDQASEG